MVAEWEKFMPAYCVEAPELTTSRVCLIQASWAKIEGGTASGLVDKREGYFGERFYEILFERYPSTKALFKDHKQQARALSKMLDRSVSLLKDIGTVADQLQKLATRHHRYGTRPEHYGPVGECLVAAITEVLADDLDSATGDAWVHLYSIICKVMIPVTYTMCKADAASENEA